MDKTIKLIDAVEQHAAELATAGPAQGAQWGGSYTVTSIMEGITGPITIMTRETPEQLRAERDRLRTVAADLREVAGLPPRLALLG